MAGRPAVVAPGGYATSASASYRSASPAASPAFARATNSLVRSSGLAARSSWTAMRAPWRAWRQPHPLRGRRRRSEAFQQRAGAHHLGELAVETRQLDAMHLLGRVP